MSRIFQCIDAGTEYCPCILAKTLDCIACSQLQGKEFCDCAWNGVCILNEYYMNNKQVEEGRKNHKGVLVKKQKIEEDLYLLKIKTEEELVKRLDRAGSYIILRGKGEQTYFDVPMSILNTAKNKYISILYRIRGCKTKILDNSNEFLIRGPYWNGILGIEYLKEIKNSNCLLISKGMGQASIGLVIKEMLKNNNRVILFLDKGELNTYYIHDSIVKEKIEIIIGKVNEQKREILNIIQDENIELVFSAGSDLLHKSVYEILKNIEKDIKLMTTNNCKICCGEGVCGSCTNRNKDGERVKGCKAKVNQKIFY